MLFIEDLCFIHSLYPYVGQIHETKWFSQETLYMVALVPFRFTITLEALALRV